MFSKFFISKKILKNWYYKEFNGKQTQVFNEHLKVYLKGADAVGGEIWKYCFLNDSNLGTLSNQISEMSGFGVDFRHLQKHFWILI